jgi:HEAT repeat protein
MRRCSLVVGILIAVMGARTARAEDAEDPGALLRKARTTEAADRDVAAAIPMYRKVMALAPASDAARDAGLRLLELLEVRGERTAALEVAAFLTERLSTRLDDDGKRKVHEAMARMLPAGSKARSPLGEIYVVPPATATSAAASPLEAKVLALLPRVDAAAASNQPGAVDLVLRDVKLIGGDAVGPLAKILRTERFDHAQFAARALAQIATPEAIEVLVTSAREGDGFVRTAAVAGLGAVLPSPEASPAYVKAVAPMLFESAFAGASRNVLLFRLADHVDDADLVRRMQARGSDASFWLRVALQRGVPAAREELERATADGRTLDDQLVSAFQDVAGVRRVTAGPAGPDVEVVPGVSPETRLAALRLLVAAKATEYRVQVAANLAVGCVHAGNAEATASAAALVWPYVLRAPVETSPDRYVETLVTGAVPLGGLVDDDALVEALLRTWVTSNRQSGRPPQPYEVAILAPKSLVARPVFAVTLARLAGEILPERAGTDRLSALVARLDPRALPPPAAAAWREVLATMNVGVLAPRDGYGEFAFRVACAATDPRALDVVRRLVAQSQAHFVERYVGILNERYAGEDRAGLAVDLLTRPWANDPPERQRLVGDALAHPAFYAALADRLDGDLDAGLAAMRQLAQVRGPSMVRGPSIYDGAPAPAAALASRWLGVLRRIGPPRTQESTATPAVVLARWAAVGDPSATLTLARARALGGAPAAAVEVVVEALVSAIASIPGFPGGRAFLVELSHKSDLSDDAAFAVVGGLARPGDDGDLARVEAIAASPAAPGARFAVQALAEGRHRDALARIVSGLAGKTVPPSPWSRQLFDAVRGLRLREAIPWLLAEAKDGAPDAADDFAKAIDQIHAHHERIAKFDALGTAARDARAEIEPLLADADPDIRAAAILSYGAVAGRDGLPRLLRLAKDEQDPGIRRTILETIDRIAKWPPPAAPTAAPATPAPREKTGD